MKEIIENLFILGSVLGVFLLGIWIGNGMETPKKVSTVSNTKIKSSYCTTTIQILVPCQEKLKEEVK